MRGGTLTLYSRVARLETDTSYRDVLIREVLDIELRFLRWSTVTAAMIGFVAGMMAGAAFVFSQWYASLPAI